MRGCSIFGWREYGALGVDSLDYVLIVGSRIDVVEVARADE